MFDHRVYVNSVVKFYILKFIVSQNHGRFSAANSETLMKKNYFFIQKILTEVRYYSSDLKCTIDCKIPGAI